MSDGGSTYTAPDGQTYITYGDLANCTLAACPVETSVYGYRASLPLSIALIVLYTLCGIIQIGLGIRYKTWVFMGAMLLGCLTEILGYVGRILMWQNPWGQTGFIMQIVLITLGPVFFSAAIYVLLSKIVIFISVSASRFKPQLFYWIFIPCDIVSLILQAAGGAMSSSSDGDSQAGVNIALAGLAFQVATLLAFVVLTTDYMWRSRKVWMNKSLGRAFWIFFTFLDLATLLIWLRCCYRVYELSEGYTADSEALRDQALFIGLEAITIIIAAYCLVVAHPGPVFNTKKSQKEMAIEESADVETEPKPYHPAV